MQDNSVKDDLIGDRMPDLNNLASNGNIKPLVEAILFVSDEPLTINKIGEIIEHDDKDRLKDVIDQLKAEYNSQGKGFQIEEIAGGYQVLSRPEYQQWVSRLIKKRHEVKLSQAGLETLAIIAYRQPIMRSDIEAIRGVQSGHLIRTLIEIGFVKVTGRAAVIGHPLLYGTTKKFLQHFGLKSIKDLPLPEEIAKDRI